MSRSTSSTATSIRASSTDEFVAVVTLPLHAPRTRSRPAAWRRFLARPAGVIGLLLVLLMFIGAVLADFVPFRPDEPYLNHLLEPPSATNPLGTDNLGRDQLSRTMHGGRISLTVAVVVAFVATLAGVPLGLAAGYVGGALDRVLTATMDILMAFPALLLAIAIAAALGQGLSTAIVAIAVVELPRFQRLTRGQVLALNQLEYISAARAIGARGTSIVLRHILPNAVAPIVVQLSLTASFAILAEASLSFLGLSVPPPAPAWGSMLNIGRGYLELAPWLSIFPGLAIALAVLGFNLIGDAARDALDPRLATLERR